MSSSSGAYVLYRWQQSTESRIIIPDVAWRMKYTLKKNRKLAITTEGEFYPILGHSGALVHGLAAAVRPEPCNHGDASIYNVMARFGIGSQGSGSPPRRRLGIG